MKVMYHIQKSVGLKWIRFRYFLINFEETVLHGQACSFSIEIKIPRIILSDGYGAGFHSYTYSLPALTRVSSPMNSDILILFF